MIPVRSGIAIVLAVGAASATARPVTHYTLADFDRIEKIDTHVHANVDDPAFINLAKKFNFKVISINVDYPDFPSLKSQADVAHKLRKAHPVRFHYVTTFSMSGFQNAGWTDNTARWISSERKNGALGVKIWKNVGMVEKDASGKKIFIDNPGFDGVMAHIKAQKMVLVAHQAEPKNCWLPLDQMTTENDRAYFAAHPEYHMYRHPEEPSYEFLIAARDRFVSQHQDLQVVGAHMGSLEWSVDALAEYLDRYPNATVDMAARMSNIQYQSARDYTKVRRFFIKYQDRILYGSDLTQNPLTESDRAQNPPIDMSAFASEAERFWRADWAYLATDTVQQVDAIKGPAKGLALPRKVIDKIYYRNANRIFFKRR